MKRVLVLVSALLALFVAATILVWTSGRSDKADLRSQVDALRDKVDGSVSRTIELRAETKDLLGERTGELKMLKREQERLRWRVSDARRSIGALEGVHRILAPEGTRVGRVTLVPTSDATRRLAIVSWSQGLFARRFGLYVWSVGLGTGPIQELPTRPVTADLVWTFDASQINGEEVVFSGPPGDQRVERRLADGVGADDSGDVTSDGVPDLLIKDETHGSGGCGPYRVLENRTTTVSEIFRRDDCDTIIKIEDGQLVVDTATYGKGCDLAHGCGRRRFWLEWNGVDWQRVRSIITDRY